LDDIKKVFQEKSVRLWNRIMRLVNFFITSATLQEKGEKGSGKHHEPTINNRPELLKGIGYHWPSYIMIKSLNIHKNYIILRGKSQDDITQHSFQNANKKTI
jgi:hypothetical protein